MPNRTAKFVSAVIASLVAGAPLATVSRGATPAADATPATDNCLATPKKGASQGGHWYYRIEHPSNRHCWYLRAEQAASNASAPAAATSPPPNAAAAMPSSVTMPGSATMPGSVANAHAELTSTSGDQGANIAAGQVPATAAGNVVSADNAAPAKAQDASMLRSVVAARWPDQLAANTATAAAPAADNASADAPAKPETPPPPAAAVVPLTAADAPPAKQSSSTQMLIIAIVGALSVAGLAASAVGFGGRRKNRAGPIENDYRAIWETTPADRPSPVAAMAAARPHIGLPKELRDADEPNDKITEMLVRLARSAQA